MAVTEEARFKRDTEQRCGVLVLTVEAHSFRSRGGRGREREDEKKKKKIEDIVHSGTTDDRHKAAPFDASK